MAKMFMMNVMVVDEDGNRPATIKTLMMSEGMKNLMAFDLIITSTGRIVKSRHTNVTNHLTAATPPEPPIKPKPIPIDLSANTRVLDI